jgi:hypothetical protein
MNKIVFLILMVAIVATGCGLGTEMGRIKERQVQAHHAHFKRINAQLIIVNETKVELTIRLGEEVYILPTEKGSNPYSPENECVIYAIRGGSPTQIMFSGEGLASRFEEWRPYLNMIWVITSDGHTFIRNYRETVSSDPITHAPPLTPTEEKTTVTILNETSFDLNIFIVEEGIEENYKIEAERFFIFHIENHPAVILIPAQSGIRSTMKKINPKTHQGWVIYTIDEKFIIRVEVE